MEPLAADTRGNSKKEILKAMDIAVIKLCAAMFGLNYDDLKQRHREQRIRTLTMIFGSIGAAVLAFAVFATIMILMKLLRTQSIILMIRNISLLSVRIIQSEYLIPKAGNV